jgi:hypothetical protein
MVIVGVEYSVASGRDSKATAGGTGTVGSGVMLYSV